MARPKRYRRICGEPEYNEFIPKGSTGSDDYTVILSLDEFEVIRLVDYEKHTHEQCAARMEISRTTVTEIYENAREKVADCLINGKRLVIAGGNYKLCGGGADGCHGRNCGRSFSTGNTIILTEKGGHEIMRIAVTYENGQIFQHFGHTAQFKVYDVEEGRIVASQVVDTNGNGHGALGGFLAANQVDVLICGGIGGGAQNALAQAGIKLYGGVMGEADAAVEALIAGELDFNPDVQCNHHEHHHGEGHTCGGHGHDNGHGCGGHGHGEGGCGNHGCH